MEVVCGPRVLVVVHCRRKDHGKDLKLSQPMLQAKNEEKKKEEKERRWEGKGGVRGEDNEEEGDIKRSR